MSNQFLQNLVEQRLHAWERAKEIMDTAAAESRDLTAEESASLDTINGDLDAKDARINDLVAREERAKKADEARASAESLVRPDVNSTAPVKTDRDKAMALVNGEIRAADFYPTEKRDMAKGSTGAPIPTSFHDELVKHMVQVGPMWETSTVLRTASGENLQVPRTTANSAATLIAEAAAITESDPTFGAFITLSSYKYAFTFQTSREFIEDSGVDILGYLAEQSGTALAVGTNTAFTTGTGTSQPNGIVTASTLGVTGAASVSGAFNADNLVDLVYSVNASYRRLPGVGFQMRDASIAAVRKLTNTGQGYIWQPSAAVGEPNTLLGYPVYSNPDVAATALNAKAVLFGALTKYWIRAAGPIRFERSDDFAFATDQITFKALVRVDGNLVDQTGAVKHFVGAAT